MQKQIRTEDLIAVIDLGSSKIRGAVGQRNSDGTVEIIAYEETDSQGIKKGAVNNISAAAFYIGQTKKLLSNKINILLNQGKGENEEKIFLEIKEFHVSLNGKIHTVDGNAHRNLGKRKVTNDIVAMLYEENRNKRLENNDEVLDIITQGYLLDKETEEFDPVGCICTEIDGLYKVVAGSPDLKHNIEMCFEEAKCSIGNYYLSPMLSAMSVVSKEEKELGCMVVDFGYGTTSIAVYHKNILRYLHVVPIGSDAVTKDISTLKLPDAMSEKLKKKYGVALEELADDDKITLSSSEKEPRNIDTKFLAGVIEARIEEIFKYIEQLMQDAGLQKEVSRMVVTGGGANLQFLAEKLKLQTGLDVRIGTPGRNIYDASSEKFDRPEFAQIIGLLMCGRTNCLQEKMPTDDRKKKRRKPAGEHWSLWKEIKGKFEKIGDIFNEDAQFDKNKKTDPVDSYEFRSDLFRKTKEMSTRIILTIFAQKFFSEWEQA